MLSPKKIIKFLDITYYIGVGVDHRPKLFFCIISAVFFYENQMYLNTIINIYAPNLGYVKKFNGVLNEEIPLLPIKIMMDCAV